MSLKPVYLLVVFHAAVTTCLAARTHETTVEVMVSEEAEISDRRTDGSTESLEETNYEEFELAERGTRPSSFATKLNDPRRAKEFKKILNALLANQNKQKRPIRPESLVPLTVEIDLKTSNTLWVAGPNVIVIPPPASFFPSNVPAPTAFSFGGGGAATREPQNLPPLTWGGFLRTPEIYETIAGPTKNIVRALPRGEQGTRRKELGRRSWEVPLKTVEKTESVLSGLSQEVLPALTTAIENSSHEPWVSTRLFWGLLLILTLAWLWRGVYVKNGALLTTWRDRTPTPLKTAVVSTNDHWNIIKFQPRRHYVKYDSRSARWYLVKSDASGRLAEVLGEIKPGTVVSAKAFGSEEKIHYKLTEDDMWIPTEEEEQFLFWHKKDNKSTG